MLGKLSRRSFLLGSASALAISRADAQGSFCMCEVAGTPASVASAWQILPITGGGYVVKFAMHTDGTMFAGVDVCAGYVRSTALNQTWTNIYTQSSLPSDVTQTPYAAGGLYSLAMDPSNSSNMLMTSGPSGRTLTGLYYSTNKGTTWSHVSAYGLTSDDSNVSNNARLNGQRIAIDPNNGNVWYVGNGSGLQITLNGGSSFAAASGIPTGGEICGVAIDPNSGTTTVSGVTVTTTIWVGVNGSGVYKSTNGGASFSLISGSPTSIGHGKLGSDGQYYCTANGTSPGNLTRISTGGTVTSISISHNGLQSFALDPVNPGRLIGIGPDNGEIWTLNAACNSGTPTALNNGNSVCSAPDAPWMVLSNAVANASPGTGFAQGWASSDCWWDPLVTTSSASLTIASSGTLGPFTVGTGLNIAVGDTLRVTNTGTYTNYMLGTVSAYNSSTGALTLTLGVSEGSGQYLGAASGGSGSFSAWTITKERIWVSTGVGVHYIDAPQAGNSSQGSTVQFTITDQSYGIENCVALTCDVWPPSAAPVVTVSDRGLFYIGINPLTATAGQPGYGPYYSTSLFEGSFAAYGQNAPSTVIFSANFGGSSYDAGISSSGGVVGTAANSNTTSWSTFGTQPPHGWLAAASSTNFIACTWGGTISYTTNGGTNWNSSTGGPTLSLGSAFEPIEPLVADSVTIGTFYASQGTKLYVSTNNGQTWTSSGTLPTAGNYPKLKQPNGQGGHLFFSLGLDFGSSASSLAALNANHPISESFYFSSNGGSSFTALLNVLEVIDFAFSAAAPGQSYPSILICGWVKVAGTYTYGWWRCDNFNPASPGTGSEVWTSLGAYPFGWYDTPWCAGGNPSRYNQWIMGCQGSSFKIFGNTSTAWP